MPERVLKYLIRHGNLGIGSRILFVGPTRPLLPRFCHELGMNGAILLDESVTLTRWQQQINLPISLLTAWGNLPFQDQEFDAVLVNETFPAYQLSLTGLEASTLTASLLASLRPGGLLVFRQRADSRQAPPECVHRPVCFSQHLRRFTGVKRTQYLRDSFWKALLRGSGLLRRHRPGYWVHSLQLPAEPISRREWLWQAHEDYPYGCCPAVEHPTMFPDRQVA